MVDELDNTPIPGVAIFNDLKTKTAITDFDGYVAIDKFTQLDKIYFQHLSYHKFSALKSFIQDTIFLSPKSTSLNEVVISASKFQQSKKEVSQNIISINSKEVQISNPQTSADLLSNSGRVFVQKSQQGGSSPVIRGFEASRVLLVVDGIRLNNAIYRAGHLQNVITVDQNLLERIEVLYGPSSTLYGSDALGGVIHMRTKQPIFSTTEKTIFKTNINKK